MGAGFDFIFDEYNKLGLTAEVSKYLVPTPPKFGFVDTNGEGEQTIDDPSTPDIDEGEPTIITEGQDNNVSFINGVFQSFGDAPDGFSEELREFVWSVGAEYTYQDSFAFRAGYFNEADDKGARKFFALGAGFKYTTINIDLSYLFSTSQVQSPLENTLRFSLTFNFAIVFFSPKPLEIIVTKEFCLYFFLSLSMQKGSGSTIIVLHFFFINGKDFSPK